MYIRRFEDITKNDVPMVGGKGASLGEMTRAGIPVPPGFIVTAEALTQYKDDLPENIKEEIIKSFDGLLASRVAVRSSAIAEDSATSSFAGQFETFLNVEKANLINNVINCLKSASSSVVQSYAAVQGVEKSKLKIAVVIQKMVDSEVSGVMFTVNPVNGEKDELMIEAIFGLGELLVQGMVTPDNFLVSKADLEIKERNIKKQDTMMVSIDGETKEVEVPEEKRNEPSLTDDQVRQIAELGINIEKHYGFPQDIEWGIERNKIYILQSRPITTLR